MFDFRMKDLEQPYRWLAWIMIGGTLLFSAAIMVGHYWDTSATSASSQQLEQTSNVPPGSQVLFCTTGPDGPKHGNITMFVEKGPAFTIDITRRDNRNWCGTMLLRDVPGYKRVRFYGRFPHIELLWVAIGWPDNIVGVTTVDEFHPEPVAFRNGIAPPVFPEGRLIDLEQIQRISIN